MSSSGTLLSDLEGKGSPGDDDLVKQIYKDMNSSLPPISGGADIMNSPNPNSTAQLAMDSGPATSHIIGRDHPTPADFAAAMHGVNRAPMPEAPAPGQMYNMGSPWVNQQAPPSLAPAEPKRNLYSRIAEEIKTPILVAILFFAFSLPAINVLFTHYIPSLVKPTGDLTTIGVLAKSVIAGAFFWVLQRIIAPLLAL
jgi:hypothetical protein